MTGDTMTGDTMAGDAMTGDTLTGGALYADIFQGGRVFTIAPGRDFLGDLARALYASVAPRLDADPFALADMTIFLPTRRAARVLMDRFVDIAGGRALLLPSIRTLGDIGDDDYLGPDTAHGDGEAAIDTVPPAISPMERLLVLARLSFARDEARPDRRASWPVAIATARELASLLDSFYTEEIAIDALRELVPEDYADHWAQSIAFLEIVLTAWPAYLESAGQMDPTARRIALLNGQARQWQKAPPDKPVILAGSTGSTPAVRALGRVIASAPHGAVILPGLDRHLDQKAWDYIDDPHPQAGLKRFVSDLGLVPGAVADWPQVTEHRDTDQTDQSARDRLISLALRPARATDDWRSILDGAPETRRVLTSGLAGLTIGNFANQDEEAGAIALRLRTVLENKNQTAMLVTANRDLARRVSLKMKRWGVSVDDSGGLPLANAPLGTFLRLVAQWLNAPGDPVLVLALMRSPFASFGFSDRARQSAIDIFDKALRGVRIGSSIDDLYTKISLERNEDLAPIAPVLAILTKAAEPAPRTFEAQMDRHLRAINLIAGGEADDGEAVSLWDSADGQTVAAFFRSLRASASHIDMMADHSYGDVLTELMRTVTLRGGHGGHPRLSILGPLEARLQSADVVILAGLNEGEWPTDPGTDPFLSRPMRQRLGLPSPEQRIGLAARDFAELVAAPCAMLTRANEASGDAVKPSRWVVRLQIIIEALNDTDAVDETAHYQNWLAALDAPRGNRRLERPAPCPPRAARPRKLYVRNIEKLLRDPYAIYAKSILRLRKLDEPSEPFSTRAMGALLHKTFEEVSKPSFSGAITRDALWRAFDALAPRFGFGPMERALNTVALDEAFDWFVDYDAARRASGALEIIEGEGAWTVSDFEPDFEIAARADRIDREADGSLYIIDYKLGRVRSDREIKNFSPQLPLTALIAQNGGFTDGHQETIRGFAYEKIMAREKDPKTASSLTIDDDAKDSIATAEAGLRALITAFDDETTAYLPQPRPQFQDDYGDYDQLSRRGEWSTLSGDEGGEE